MDRRMWKIKPSCHVLLILFLPMKLLSQPPTIGLTLSIIFAEHVEASKQTLGKKVELPSLTPLEPHESERHPPLEGDHTDSLLVELERRRYLHQLVHQ
jgi:hypothetical protein